LSSQQDDL